MTSLWNGSGLVVRSNGTNTGSALWQADRDASIDITASNHDAHDENIADTIERTLNLDAENSPAANINWGDNKITNLADGTGAQDAANLRVVQAGGFSAIQTSGDGTNYTATFSPAITSLTNLMRLSFLFHTGNAGQCDIAINGLTAVPLRDFRGRQLPPSEIVGNRMIEFFYLASVNQLRMLHPPESPEGTVRASASATEEFGWLFCDGSAISRTDYVRLFDEIGTAFGGGDGSTTFNIPDMRGRSIAGKDDMGGTAANRLTSGSAAGLDGTTLGAVGGVQEHANTIAEMPNHHHGLGPSNRSVLNNNSGTADSLQVGGSARFSVTFTAEGGGAAHTNVQPTAVLNYLIKA